jgi:ankyrin repeat protein
MHANLFSAEIMKAIEFNNFDKVRSIINENPGIINKSYKYKNFTGPPLHFSVIKKKSNIVDFLIKNGADVNKKDNFCNTPLHYAVISNDISTLKILLSQNVEINSKNKDYNTPLLLFRKDANYKIIESLLKNGANVNSCNGVFTPLKLSMVYFRSDIERLIKQYGGINSDDLFQSIINGNSLNIPKLIEKYPDLANARWNYRKTLLHVSAEKGDINLVKYLVGKIDVDVLNNHCLTPLHLAVANANLEVVRFLLDYGANIKLKNEEGFTVLHFLTKEIRKNMIEGQELVDLKNNYNENHLKIANLLIKKGADINALDELGRSPIYLAVLSNQMKYVKYLLDKKADCTITDVDGKSPLEIAKEKSFIDLYILLEKHCSGIFAHQ